MKHIIPFNELRKSTYREAADKLGTEHKKRGEELIKHAHLKGENQPVDKIWPDRFNMEEGHPDEYWSIVECNSKSGKFDWATERIITLKMISNWGKEGYLKVKFYQYCPGTHQVDESYLDFNTIQWRHSNFRFKTRKEALALYKFLEDYFQNQEEYGENDDPWHLDIKWYDEKGKRTNDIRGLTINKLWKSS
jgi:hypothetical protein